MKKSFLFLSVILSISCFSQISQYGIPLSFTQTLSREVHTIIITPPNTNLIESEENENALKGKTNRYSVQVETDIDAAKDGLWENLENDIRVWRINIKSEGAKALGLYYNSFWIPSNGKLFVYNSDKTKLLGAYTNLNNHESGVFANEIIEDNKLTLEYIQKGEGNPIIKINQVSYVQVNKNC